MSPDRRLRRAGFRIHARPEGRPAVWTREGKLYPVDVALKIAQREAAEKAGLRGGVG